MTISVLALQANTSSCSSPVEVWKGSACIMLADALAAAQHLLYTDDAVSYIDAIGRLPGAVMSFAVHHPSSVQHTPAAAATAAAAAATLSAAPALAPLVVVPLLQSAEGHPLVERGSGAPGVHQELPQCVIAVCLQPQAADSVGAPFDHQ